MASLVSIIIPTFNRRDYLKRAIESSLNQTWRNVEVIVVDDGSTDGTVDDLRVMAEKLGPERFRYIQQANLGASAARNSGLASAKGSYVKFLDSDDELDLASIEAFVRVAEALGVDLALGSRSTMSPEGRVWRPDYVPPNGLIDSPLRKFFDLELKPQGALWFYRRDIFNRNPWNEELRTREDTELLVALLTSGCTVCGVPRALYHQRYHNEGRLMDSQFEEEQLEGLCNSYERQLDWLRAAGCRIDVMRAFAASISRTVLRLWREHPKYAKRMHAISRRAFLWPELRLGSGYRKVHQVIAYIIWLICGPGLSARIWTVWRARSS